MHTPCYGKRILLVGGRGIWPNSPAVLALKFFKEQQDWWQEKPQQRGSRLAERGIRNENESGWRFLRRLPSINKREGCQAYYPPIPRELTPPSPLYHPFQPSNWSRGKTIQPQYWKMTTTCAIKVTFHGIRTFSQHAFLNQSQNCISRLLKPRMCQSPAYITCRGIYPGSREDTMKFKEDIEGEWNLQG